MTSRTLILLVREVRMEADYDQSMDVEVMNNRSVVLLPADSPRYRPRWRIFLNEYCNKQAHVPNYDTPLECWNAFATIERCKEVSSQGELGRVDGFGDSSRLHVTNKGRKSTDEPRSTKMPRR